MSCERVIEVEDLVLGLVQGSEAEALEAHLASCADCIDARAMFVAERSLFETREIHVAAVAVPPLVLPKPAIARVYRFVPAIAALAACIAIFIGRAHVADDCDEPTPAAVATIKLASIDEVPLGTGVCRAPLSEPFVSFVQSAPAPAVSLASHDEFACVPSPHSTCEVTSSTAMP